MPEMLRATVTFLFTGIEGSARFWEQSPQTMEAAVVHHGALVTEIFEQHVVAR